MYFNTTHGILNMMRHRKRLLSTFLWMRPIIVLLSSIICFDGVFGCDHDRHSLVGHMNEVVSHTSHRHLNDEGEEESEIELCGYEELSPVERLEDQINMLLWSFERNTDPDAPPINYTVPTYFHILQVNNTDPLVSDSNVAIYMNYLSDAFIASGAPFRFPLMGITRTVNATISNDCRSLQNDYKPRLKRGGKETLNIFVCNSIPNGPNGGSITGFATLPSRNPGTNDGVTIVRTTPTDLNRPNTLVHEVGHYLGLFHTFNVNCTTTGGGDQVDDTPHHVSKAQEVNCRTPTSTWDTCPEIPGLDPVDNYMTYTVANHACRTKFTTGQVDRMMAQFEIYRYEAPTSTPTNRPIQAPIKLPTVAPKANTPNGMFPPTLSPIAPPVIATPITNSPVQMIIPIVSPITTPILHVPNPVMITTAPTRSPTNFPLTTTPTTNPSTMPSQFPTTLPSKTPTVTSTIPSKFPNVPMPPSTTPKPIVSTIKPSISPPATSITVQPIGSTCKSWLTLCNSNQECCGGSCRNFFGIFRNRCSIFFFLF